MYWVLESVEENYLPNDTDALYSPSEDATLMHEVIVEASLVCGVETPRTLSALLAKVDRYQSGISVEAALGTRGAILRRGSVLYVSLGDEVRMVGANVEGSISVYRLTNNDRDPDYWTGAFKLPELRYL